VEIASSWLEDVFIGEQEDGLIAGAEPFSIQACELDQL
jgi:hypothetical protein